MANLGQKFVEENFDKEEVLKKYRSKLPPGFQESLETLPWDSIATIAEEYKLKISKESKELRTVQKELSLALMIIRERLKHQQGGEVAFDVRFLKGLLKLLERSYKVSIEYEVDIEEFMILITLIIEKLKKEKVIVYDQKGRGYNLIKKMKPRHTEFDDIPLKLGQKDEDDDDEED